MLIRSCNWTSHDDGVHDRKHGHMPAGRAILEVICSSCAVCATVTIPAHVHASGNSVDFHTHRFPVTISSLRVLSQSGYVSVQQLATLPTTTLLTPSFLV
jgi:hypothetical protein